MSPKPPVFIPTRYKSRYSLLGRMCEEFAQAFEEAGYTLRPLDDLGRTPGVLLYINFMAEDEDLWRTVMSPRSRLGLVQFFVDHPLALSTTQMDRLARLPHFRMALPCVDSVHLLRMRWPSLRHTHCLHGAPRSALCDPASLEAEHLGGGVGARGEQLVVLGSIHSQEEIDALWESSLDRVRRPAREMVELLLEHPWMPFEQAMDVAVGGDGVAPGEWALAAGLFRMVAPTVNRRRRIALVEAMQGVPTAVYGGQAWAEVCTGSLRYAGQVDYADVASTMATARICLAWGPTQFTHSFSERLLLSMAAGSATVADDRLLVRKHFATEGEDQCVALFDAAKPESARAAVESLLADPQRALALATRGRAEVERAHLWAHRVPALTEAGVEALAA